MGALMKLDTSGFDGIIRQLENAGADVKKAVDDALSQAAEKIKTDTESALSAPNLPAGGKYSKGQTAKSVVTDTTPKWQGDTAWIPVGFDFAKPGAGGFLITGTPKMRPDMQLNKMYKSKKYMADIQEQIGDTLMKHLSQSLGKG